MKKLALLTLAIFALVVCNGVAQTKFIAHRSHSGTDRLFNPDGAGNFGELSHYEEWIQPDTLKKNSTETSPALGINWNFGSPGDGSQLQWEHPLSYDSMGNNRPRFIIPAPEQKNGSGTTESSVRVESLIPSMAPSAGNEEEVKPATEPTAPQTEIPAIDTAQPVQPDLSNNGVTPSPAEETSALNASEQEQRSKSGMLLLLAVGLALPAAIMVGRGLRRREDDLG